MKRIAVYERRRGIAHLTILIGVVCVAVLACWLSLGILPQMWKAHRASVRLLHQTDYTALRDAGRALLKQFGDKPGVYKISDHPQSPAVAQFPKVILDLAPESVMIAGHDYVVIMMFANGFQHVRAFIYSEEYEETHPGAILGDRMLVEGLWYSEDG
jgi:hypothetical protein